MDDKTKTGKADDIRIDVNEPYELQYWSETLNVSREQLREAIRVVGPDTEKVREYLAQNQ